MSMLVVLLPPRERAAGTAAETPAAPRAPAEYAYVLSPDGLAISAQGRAAPALLPKADSVMAVLSDTDVAWHRIPLPKAPQAKLRAALAGVLEEAVLDDADDLHFALAPGAAAGQPAWVAAVHKSWLARHLVALEQSGVPVERVLPSSWPDETPLGHFAEAPGATAGSAMSLTWSSTDGVVSIRLQGGLAHAMLPQWTALPARWSATPAVAAPAERWLGAAVMVLTEEQRALQAARSLWNLRQFGLARRNRGARALRDALRQWRSPGWRPVRIGLAGLVAVQIVGLNLWALHLRGQIDTRRQALVDVLKTAHPQVRAVLDAPLQMLRETETLRAAAGRPGEADLEPMLNAAAAAWPDSRPPATTLRFEPGRLSFAAADWNPSEIEQFRRQLQPAGWKIDMAGGALSLSRVPLAAAGAGS